MDKNKSLYFSLIVIFCVVIAGLGGYYLGITFSNNEDVTVKYEKKEETYEKEVVKDNNDELTKLPTLSEPVYVVLYNYLKSGKNNLIDYLSNLNNNQKLYVAGLINWKDERDENKTYTNLRNYLIEVFGTDLNISASDYYTPMDDEEPWLIYNKETDKFIDNEKTNAGDTLFDLSGSYIYNFKLKDTSFNEDKYIVTYYGLYACMDEIGPTILSNDKNIDRYLNYEDDTDGLTGEEYLEKIFNNNKDDFFQFIYTYKKVNDKYILVDFKQA